MSYDGLEIFHKRLQDEKTQAAQLEERLNPKLKQFYEIESKIEPFYTGGKVSVLSPCHFACKSGGGVKIVSTAINSIVKLEDSEIVSSADEDTKVHETSGSFGILGTYECELDEIISFDTCPFTHTLVTAHKSQLLRLWDLNTKETTRTIKSFHSTPVGILEVHKSKSSALTKNGLTNGSSKSDIISVDEDSRSQLTWTTIAGNVVKVWDAGGSLVSKAIRIEGIPSVGFAKWDYSSTGKKNRLFIAERNIYTIEMDEVTKQFAISQTLEGHYSQVTGIEWGPGNIMVSGGRDKTLIVWDTSNSTIQKVRSLAFPGVIESMTLLSRKDLYIASVPGTVRHMDLETMKLSTDVSLAWDDEESIVALHSPLCRVDDSEHFFISTHTCAIYQVGKSHGKKKSAKGILRVRKQFVGSLDEILCVTLWESDKVAVANNTSVIKTYDLKTGSCQFLRGHKDIVLSMSSQEEWLVSGSKDNRIIFWKSSLLEPHAVLEGHIASVTAVCFDPTKHLVYSVSEDTFLKSWTEKKCLKSAVAHEKEIHVVHCSPNGAMLATGSRDKTAKIWDSEHLQLLGSLKGHKKSVWDVKFSPWDQLVITSSADTTLKIWNIATFECIQTLQGHSSSVLQCRFINSGLQAISTSSDGTWKTWDLRTSACLSTMESSEDKIWALDCTPDGQLVVTGSADSVLTIWKDITDQKVAESLSRKKKNVEDEQKLNNVVRNRDWTQAIYLAIELDRPFTLLKVIREIPDTTELTPILGKLSKDQKFQLLGYVLKWNTNTRTSTEAQVILNILLKSTRPKDMGYLETSGLLPYTIKHFQRLTKAQQDVSIVQYLASQKDL